MSALTPPTADEHAKAMLRATPVSIAKIRSSDRCDCNTRLNDIELVALYLYTTEHAEYSYRVINRELTIGAPEPNASWHQIGQIDSALAALPTFSGHCYRSEEVGGRIHSKAQRLIADRSLATADEVTELCAEFFMSTSLDRALNLRGKAVEIIIAAVFAGCAISHLSLFPDEEEILFKRNTRFLILETQLTLDSYLIFLGEI